MTESLDADGGVIWLIDQSASTPETGSRCRHYYLARGLEKLGYTVYVVAASYTHLLRKLPQVTQRYTLERREGINMVWVQVPRYAQAHSKGRVRNWLLFAWYLRGLSRILPERPDAIVYSSPGLFGYLGAERLARRIGSRLVFEVRDIWPLTLCEVGGYSTRHPFIRAMQWIENRAYRNADVVLSNLKNSWQHMVSHGLDKTKFRWIPNGIWLDEVQQPQALDIEVAQQFPSKGAFVVGYTGTLGLSNCMDTLIDAADQLQQHQDIQFMIIGDGRERGHLERLVRDKRLTNVAFTGAIPKAQVQSALGRCNTLFLAVKKSPLYDFGVALNKLYDYLYAGRPILYAIESGDYHPVTDAGAGLELPAEDAQALAAAILQLKAMPADEREAMGARGRQLAVSEYEYGGLAERFARAVLSDLPAG